VALSFLVAMVTSLSYYSTGRWRRPVLRRRVIPPTPAAIFGDEAGEA